MATDVKDALIAVLEQHGSPRVAVEHDADAILAHPAEVLAAMVEAGVLRVGYVDWAGEYSTEAHPLALVVYSMDAEGDPMTTDNDGSPSESEG